MRDLGAQVSRLRYGSLCDCAEYFSCLAWCIELLICFMSDQADAVQACIYSPNIERQKQRNSLIAYPDVKLSGQARLQFALSALYFFWPPHP